MHVTVWSLVMVRNQLPAQEVDYGFAFRTGTSSLSRPPITILLLHRVFPKHPPTAGNRNQKRIRDLEKQKVINFDRRHETSEGDA